MTFNANNLILLYAAYYMLLDISSIWPIYVSFTSIHTCWGLGGQVTASGPPSWSGLIAEWSLWSGWSHNPTRVFQLGLAPPSNCGRQYGDTRTLTLRFLLLF